MDMEGSREECASTHEPVQIKLPISNKKRGNYKPNLSHFTITKSQKYDLSAAQKRSNTQNRQAVLSIKKTQSKNKKQKIAILSWDGPHEESDKAPATLITKLATALAKDGQEIHVFTRGEKGEVAKQKVDGVYYHRIHVDSTLPLMKGASIFANKICERIKRFEAKEKPFDVIHCYNWHPAKAVKNLQNGIPRRIVFTMHTNGKHRDLSQDEKFGPQKDLLEKELIKNSDNILFFDQKMRTEIQNRLSLPEEKISILENEFNWQDYQWVKDSGEIKKKYDLWPLDPLVLFVGGFDHNYAPDILADAIPALLKNTPQLRFLFIGDGELMWTIRIKAHYLLFEHAIRLVGHKEGRELQELFQAADIVVVPNRCTTTPYQILAAWSARKPVVATHAGSCGLIKHEENGIQVYDNPNSIVWGIERILFDWDKGHEIAQKGWTHIQENYTWDAIGQKVESIYQSKITKTLKKKKG
ncbi:MAG: glycosyltransferase family 4 protein [bacterium]